MICGPLPFASVKLVPETVINVPTGADFGLKSETTGGGVVVVKVCPSEVPPPGAGLKTVTWAAPTAAIRLAGTCAVSCVAEINVVMRFVPFQLTTEMGMKLVPFTVSANAAPPAVAVLGDIELRDGTGLFA